MEIVVSSKVWMKVLMVDLWSTFQRLVVWRDDVKRDINMMQREVYKTDELNILFLYAMQ